MGSASRGNSPSASSKMARGCQLLSQRRSPVAKSVVTPERFASGMTFEEYVVYIGSPENLAREGFGYYGGSFGAAPRKDNSTVIRERYTRARLAAHQREAITWLAAHPRDLRGLVLRLPARRANACPAGRGRQARTADLQS